jgi:N-hydroxyarylamine O-acetyltransferase
MAPASDPDVGAYLERLRLDAEAPSADALRRLHRAQVEQVPYETLWIHMGDLWSVDLNESFQRVARRQRGGYCYHVNGALSRLLQALGYRVTLHVGGVHGPEGPTPDVMTNHLVLLVHDVPSTENPTGVWYLDAGLGDALHDPLPLSPGRSRQGPFEFGLERSDTAFADWQFHHRTGGSFTGMVFSAEPTTIDAFALRNTHLSTSPDSGFVKTVTVQRREAGGVDILRGQVLTRVGGESSDSRTLESRSEWFDALTEVFHVPLEDVTAEQRDRLWRQVERTHQAWLASR